MRYFLDTEFSERGPDHAIELISVGLVTEGDLHYYGVSSGFYTPTCNNWVKENVLPNLSIEQGVIVERKSLKTIRADILAFIGSDKPEFWGYYSAYDWVVFCQIFGTMMDLPKGWPMYCRDLKQECDRLGNPRLPDVGKNEHNALADARWNRSTYFFLKDQERKRAL